MFLYIYTLNFFKFVLKYIHHSLFMRDAQNT